MSEPVDPNEDTSTAGLGERRRRREAERVRARAAGLSTEPPLTRRERRARDEALASGALMLGPEGLVPTGSFEPIPDPQAVRDNTGDDETVAGEPSGPRDAAAQPVPDAAPEGPSGIVERQGADAPGATHETSGQDSAPQDTPAQLAVDTAADSYPNTRSGRRARRAAEAAARAGAEAERAAEPLATDDDRPTSTEPAVSTAPGATTEPASTTESAATAEPADRTDTGAAAEQSAPATPPVRTEQADAEGTGALTTSSQRVTRRSLRAKQADAPAPAQMTDRTAEPATTGRDAEPSTAGREAEPTTTGRRPVVRPPASVQATRGVDATGGLTAVQRAVREANTSGGGLPIQVEAGEADSPTSWGSAVDLPTVTEEVSGTDPQPTQAIPEVRRVSARSLSQSSPSRDSAAEAAPAEQLEPGAGTPTDAGPAPSAATPTGAGPGAGAATAEGVETGVSAETPASPPSAADASSADGDGEDEDTGAFDMKPRWEALGIAAQAAHASDASTRSEAAPAVAPTRVSARRTRAEENEVTQGIAAEQAGAATIPATATRLGPPATNQEATETNWADIAGARPAEPAFTEDPEDETEQETRKTPKWLFALQMVVLALVAVVLALLVWQLAAGNLFDDEDSLGAGLVLSAHALWPSSA